MKTLKLFTADGRALTNLCEVVAHHADSGDVTFDTLDDLCAEYGLDLEEVRQLLAEVA